MQARSPPCSNPAADSVTANPAAEAEIQQQSPCSTFLPVQDPRAKQQQRVAFADFSAALWQGFEKSERGPNNSSLFQPQAAVVIVAQG